MPIMIWRSWKCILAYSRFSHLEYFRHDNISSKNISEGTKQISFIISYQLKNSKYCIFVDRYNYIDDTTFKQIKNSNILDVMDRDTNDVSLIRYVHRPSIPMGHSPIFQCSYRSFWD